MVVISNHCQFQLIKKERQLQENAIASSYLMGGKYLVNQL